jgi:hypothetical protein
MPLTRADTTVQLIAGETLNAGSLINVYTDLGTVKARKADASVVGKEAHGYVLAGVSLGSSATVYFAGLNNNFSGLTAGLQYLSATTPGQPTTTPPSVSGGVVQKVGIAVSQTAIIFNFGEPVGLA